MGNQGDKMTDNNAVIDLDAILNDGILDLELSGHLNFEPLRIVRSKLVSAYSIGAGRREYADGAHSCMLRYCRVRIPQFVNTNLIHESTLQGFVIQSAGLTVIKEITGLKEGYRYEWEPVPEVPTRISPPNVKGSDPVPVPDVRGNAWIK